MPVGFIYFYKVVFPLFISGLSSIITQWQITIKAFKLLNQVSTEVKWAMNNQPRKKSTYSKTLSNQLIYMWYYALRHEMKNGGHVLALVVVVGSADHEHPYTHVFPSGSVVKNLPAMQEQSQESEVRSPGREDPLDGGMENHSSILFWRIPCTEEPGGLQSTGLQRDGHD